MSGVEQGVQREGLRGIVSDCLAGFDSSNEKLSDEG